MSYVEEAIKRTGWGLYSKFLVAFTIICAFCNGVSFIIMPLFLPILRCDLSLSRSMVYSIDASIPLAFALGGFLFCAIGDVVGRKSAINSSLVITFSGILTSCFAYNGGSIIVSILIIGTGLATNTIITKIHLAETLPMKYRGRCIILLDIFWALGNILGVSTFVVFMPLLLKTKTNNLWMFSWRFLNGFSGIFIISAACTTGLILPSPRYLLYEKRSGEALQVLRQIYAINTSKMSTNYGITENDLQGKIGDFGVNTERDIPNNVSTKRCGIILRRIHKATITLLRKKFICSMFLILCLRLATCIGLFHLTMLLVNTMHFTPNCNLSGLTLQHFEYQKLFNCNSMDIETDAYNNYLILSMFLVFGHVVAAATINHVEKKHVITLALFLSGVLLIFLSFIKDNYPVRLLLSSLIIFSFAICYSFLNITVIEIFPTALRGTAFGETLMIPGIAITLIENYLPISCFYTLIGVGVLFLVGASFSLLIPKLKNKPMVD